MAVKKRDNSFIQGILAIVAIVAIVGLVVMFSSGKSPVSQKAAGIPADSDAANLAGQAGYLEGVGGLVIPISAGTPTRFTYPLDEAMDPAEAIAPIANAVLIVKNRRGGFYNPQFNFNNMGQFLPGEGYQITTTRDVVLDFTHWLDDELPLVLDFNEGWNFFIYPSEEGGAVEAVVEPIVDAVVMVKDSRGRFYYPEFDFNNIPLMEYGRGYQIQVNQEVVLDLRGLSCEDSDGGVEGVEQFIAGNIIGVNETGEFFFEDRCVGRNNTTVHERSCNGVIPSGSWIRCENGCENRACLR